MADNFKDGVSRVLEVANRQISNVIWQQEKPPLDSELNLMGQVSFENLSEAIRKNTHSGFLLDPTRADEDFVFYEQSSNYFEIKRDIGSPLIALVNGWVVPVLGSESSDGVTNAIKLPAPPTTDSETNVVFLEVWEAVLEASTADNKPDASSTYPYGNVLYSASSDQDEMIDPTLGFETTKRVQVQYRLRVQGSNVDLVTYPEGLGDADIVAQGASASPVLGYSFSNQKDNGDAGLWRAGDGSESAKSDLGTVDGYVYAIPVCAVFRRNSNLYQAISAGAPNHNGSVSRRPTATSERLSAISLGQALTASDTGVVSYGTDGVLNSAFDDPNFFGISYGGTGLRFLEIGSGQDREIISITSVDTINKTFTIAGRGRAGTQAKPHALGERVEIRLSRPDGLYADQVASQDVLDLRHSVTLGEWDYTRLLENAVRDLLVNEMRTTFKQAGSGSNSVGKKVEEVSVLVNLNGESRNYANVVDAPDGVRTIWSDAPVMQKDVTFLVDPTTATNASGVTTNSMDATLQSTWTIGAKFNPNGFLYDNEPIQNGAFVKFNIGGVDNVSGARAGFKPDLDINVVRFISPQEAGRKFSPFKVKFTGYNRPNGFGETGTQGQSVAPTAESNFETPFIVLGDSFFSAEGLVVNTTQGGAGNLRNLSSTTHPNLYAIRVSTDLDSIYETSVLHGTTTISELVTNQGRDISGLSSKAYLVVYGDKGSTISNNGVFKVVGLGSASPFLGITTYKLSGDLWEGEGNPQNWIYLMRVGSTSDDFVTDITYTLSAEMRTQYLDSRDNECVVAFTACSDADRTSFPNLPPVANRTSPILISTTLQYPPARGATARVLDNVHTIALRNITTNYLRNAPSVLDVDAVGEMPLPNGEVYLPANNHIESWSKLDLSDTKEISIGEIKKESEAFIDVGSKTFVLRPYQDHGIRLSGHTLSQSAIGAVNYTNGFAKFDASLQMFSDSKTEVYAVPEEIMPTFGRQDIPYHTKTSTNDPYMEGINHLFLDKRDTTSNSFNIVGGRRNGTGVYPMMFATGSATGGVYGQWVANSPLANQGVLVAKKVALTEKPTSEFGDVLNGIKLPPFFGVARLVAVYEATDFSSKAPNAGIGAHETDRETPVNNAPVNLLRKDNDLFPLYIQRGGGAEITAEGEEEAHTYIVTEHAINLRNIPTYAEGQTFSDFNYVVECTVFGFGLGFINENNFVLARKYTPSDNPIGVVGGTSLTNIRMCLPSAVSHTDEVYIAGTRTVYQGDPFHTIGGASPSYTDQPYRYGMVSPSNAFLFNTPRGQEESDGTSAIEVTNKRSFEVLASMDFFTTMGTGAIGGYLRRNSLNDVGYPNYFNANAIIPSGKRIPSTSTQSLPQTKIGLFTEALDERSTTASASLTLFSSQEAYYVNSAGGALASYLKVSVINDAIGVNVSYEVNPANPPANFSELTSALVSSFSETSVVVSTEERSNSTTFSFFAPVQGEEGNRTRVEVSLINPTTGLSRSDVGYFTKLHRGVRVGSESDLPTPSVVLMTGGATRPVNAVSIDAENPQIDPSLVGLTSRLPLGILVSDHDFMCEDILRDETTRLQTIGSKLTSTPSVAGSDEQGRPYTKIVGGAGDVLHMGDGEPLSYGAFPLAGGTKKYRVFRGGGAVYGASGSVKGAPLTFLNESFPIERVPVLKGSVLACRAMLVRNFEESAFNAQNLSVRSYGDEIQLLIATEAVFQANNEPLLNGALKIGGDISPSGYGEGFACADRFRVKGLPLIKGNTNAPADNEPAKLSLSSSRFVSLS